MSEQPAAPSADPAGERIANIAGLGLIGGSIALALRKTGWVIWGTDADPDQVVEAQSRQIIDHVGVHPAASISFVATPVGGVAEVAKRLLAETSGVVTDVGSVKAPIVSALDDDRFVAGHPMAGSEQIGLAGANPDMFAGAVWVLTPGPHTSDGAYAIVREIVTALGADVVTLDAARHDELVAMVSHVPHLTAVTLMRLATQRSDEQRVLLRLAAGGFRDMTRIAAGHPGIWPDICAANSPAIVAVLDDLIAELAAVREQVALSDREALSRDLEDARVARQNLPSRGVQPEFLSEVRVPIPDRKGELASVMTLASNLDVNVYDIEIAHTSEGTQGVLIMVVDTENVERLSSGLLALDYAPRHRPLS